MKKIFLSLLILLFTSNLLAEEERFFVSEVLDGNTLVINNRKKIKLIGVSAPQLSLLNQPEMYFSQEAHQYLKNLVENKEVKIKYDVNNEYFLHKDEYGRYLAYVHLLDGTFTNAELIKLGYAILDTRLPFIHSDSFIKYQQKAIEGQRGLWAELHYNPETSYIVKLHVDLNSEGQNLLKKYAEYLMATYKKSD